MKAAALAYAARLGWRLFPVALDGRTPIKGKSFENGVHSATSDPAEIERRWSLHPTANLAMACGSSNVVALDVDVKSADGRLTLAELEDEHGWLPETPTARTPSGGQHILFAAPADRALRNRVGFAPGLDIRATGGSICLAPSRRPDGRYTWDLPPTAAPLAEIPAWLLKLIDPPEAPRPERKPLDLSHLEKAARYVEAAVLGEARAVAETAANTGRNVRLFQASANLGELIGANLLPERVAAEALEDAAHECGLVRDDGLHAVRATIRSGIGRGLQRPREVCLGRR